MKTKLLKFLLIMILYSYANAEDCVGDTTSQWNECSGTINSWYGSYIGDFKDGMKHGKGIIHYYNGDKFVGEFRDGKKTAKVLLLILVVKRVLENGKTTYLSVNS